MSLFKLPKNIYTSETILKTAYLFQDKVLVKFISSDSEFFVVELSPIDNCIIPEEAFIQALQEQQLREVLNSQFGGLRDEIYKKAFSVVG